MKKISLTILLQTTFFFLSAVLSNAQDQTLLTIHDQKVSLEEFRRIYLKNNQNAPMDRESVEEYLELFINFKIKVLEAMERKMDTSEAFRKELAGYRMQLAKPYLVDESYNEWLMKEAYERMQYEIRASHILIAIDESAAPADTLRAYQKAMLIRERLMQAEPFANVARGTSDDPSVRNNGGDLGYFSVFGMVYPFETGVYQTPVGQISLPVRTQFGYHILKVADKRPARGQIQTAHIMMAIPEDSSPELHESKEKMILEISQMLKEGADFAELAMEYSDDKASGSQGGVLPWFSVGRMVDEFENAAFELEKDGDISAPVRTPYGWHIIKRLAIKPVGSYEEVKNELSRRVRTGDRYNQSRNAFVDKLKTEYGCTENRENLGPFYHLVDSSVFTGQWDSGKTAHLNGELFRFADTLLSQQDFARFLERVSYRRKIIPVESLVNNVYDQYVRETVLKYEEDNLEKKYPDFRYLMKEYHDGMLLFEITDQEVWSKAVIDTAGLEKFHKAHKNSYLHDKRADVSIIKTDGKVNQQRLIKVLRRGKPGQHTEDFLHKKMKLSPADSLIKLEHVTYAEEDFPWQGQVPWEKGIYPAESKGGEQVLVRINQIVPPEPKKLEEVRGLVTADYQNYLEEKWVGSLREKYDINVNTSLLEFMIR